MADPSWDATDTAVDAQVGQARKSYVGPRDDDGSLTRRTAAGLHWSYLSAGTSAVTQLLYVAAMSRLLSRAAFGLMAMSQIAVNFGLFFSRMGVTQTLIQRAQLSQAEVRVSATSSTLFGTLFALLGFLAAPWIGTLYGEQAVVPLVRALSLTFVPIGMGIASLALLRREMRFREIALIGGATTIIAASVGVGAALVGAGVWSLVAATITSTSLTTLLHYWRVRHPLRPLLTWKLLRSLYASGSRFSFLRLTEFLGRNLDTLAVGRYLTPAITGVYSRVYTLVNMPLSQYLSLALAKVLFASFAIIQNDQKRLRGAVKGGFLIAGLMLFPAGAGMAVAAPELVAVVLGDKFVEGATLVPFFAIAAVFYVLSHIAQMACEAVGDLNRTIAVQLSSLAALIALLGVAANLEVTAFAAALATAELVRHVAYLALLRSVVGLQASAVRAAYAPALTAAAAVAGAIAGARQALLAVEAPVLAILAAEMAVGGLVLLGCIRFLPFPWMRQELRRRMRALGLQQRGHARVERLVGALVGPPPPGREL